MANFKEISSNPNFPEMEREIIEFWKKNRIFEKSVEQRPENNYYSFYDGPPFITGLPHYGHLLGSIAKDFVPRYQTMKGKRVRRVWGWDCHGLPVEEKTEKKLGLKNRRDIEKLGIEKFINGCREYVSKTSAEWNWYIDRIARWVDMEHAYKTMDLKYMESVIWAFKKIYEQGLIYKGLKTLLYCTRCGTPVSKFEIAMDDSYADMEDPSVTLEFPVISEGKFKGAQVLAWTTTPWTLPSNRALVIDENETYIEFESKESGLPRRQAGKKYITAEKRLEYILGKEKHKELSRFKGKELIGLEYQPLYEYFPANKKDFKIYSFQGMVNMEEGTGIVHSAPGFGEIDTEMGSHYGLTMMFSIDDEGKFIDEVKDFKGIYVKEADALIISDLEKKDRLFKKETITHRYPYCYRCETPLIYRSVKAWFINIQKIKDEMLRLNEKINWVPEYLKDGRVKNTISEAPDWCISRTRYWATAMPVWECEKCQAIKVVGSVKEIEENSIEKVKIDDLHRTGVDKIKFKCEKCGETMNRIPEVLDCWFESGSMPYGERHYPFENREEFHKSFPADYIVEYVGQTRAWFYYLHALSTILPDLKSNCFKNVVVTGTMAGTDGRKMSKTYGNYPDPKEVLERYGGDALRLYLMKTRLMAGEDVKITKGEELAEQVKGILLPLWNCYNFFITFANLTGWKPVGSGEETPESTNHLDVWFIQRLDKFLAEFSKAMDEYHIPETVGLVHPFIDDFSKWYIRRSRDRFKGGDKQAFEVLYWALLKTAKILAPLAPFVSESIYLGLTNGQKKESVHLEDWPTGDSFNENVLGGMEAVRNICGLAHTIRKEKGIGVRQPVAALKFEIPASPAGRSNSKFQIDKELIDLIKDEVNIKSVEIVKEIQEQEGWAIKEEDNLGVALDIRLTDELKEEGFLRNYIRELQQLRKKIGLGPNDKALRSYEVPEKFKKILQDKEYFVSGVTSTTCVEPSEINKDYDAEKEFLFDGEKIRQWLKKEKDK